MSRRMTKVLCIIMAVAAAMFAGSSVAEAATTFRILSYNVKHGEGMDRRLDILRTADVVKRANPTYAGLQEVDQMTRRVAVGSAENDHWSCPSGEHAGLDLARPAWGKDFGRCHYFLRPGEHDLNSVDWSDYMAFAKRKGW